MTPEDQKYFAWIYNVIADKHSKGYGILREGLREIFVREVQVDVASTDDLVSFFKRVMRIFFLAAEH